MLKNIISFRTDLRPLPLCGFWSTAGQHEQGPVTGSKQLRAGGVVFRRTLCQVGLSAPQLGPVLAPRCESRVSLGHEVLPGLHLINHAGVGPHIHSSSQQFLADAAVTV